MTTGTPRGDRRREALLQAMDSELRVRCLDDISVADLTDAAGITRSAFYFYFDSKAAAVTALLSHVEDQARESTHSLVEDDGPFRDRITGTLERLADRVIASAHVYRALLSARTTHEPSRETWDSGRLALAAPLAEFIRTERAAGLAPDGQDADTLAVLLVRVNESLLEQLAYRPDLPRHPLIDTAADLWVRAIYGRTDTEDTRDQHA